MKPDQIEEIWAMLDREYLAEVAYRGPEPVFATVSGAHLYGFASPDSDVDLRGAFLLPARDLLGLRPSDETLSIADKTRSDVDWVAHDVRKFARLMTNHNGYVLEQLFSPLVVVARRSTCACRSSTSSSSSRERSKDRCEAPCGSAFWRIRRPRWGSA